MSGELDRRLQAGGDELRKPSDLLGPVSHDLAHECLAGLGERELGYPPMRGP